MYLRLRLLDETVPDYSAVPSGDGSKFPYVEPQTKTEKNTVAVIKNKLRSLGAKLSGNKNELVERYIIGKFNF